MKKITLILVIFFSINCFGQNESQDDIGHVVGSGSLTSITYSIPRNHFNLPFYQSALISLGVNEVFGQIIEHANWNVYDKKDLRFNRYGTAIGILVFEFFKKRNRIKELEKSIEDINKSLTNLGKVSKFKIVSLELSRR